ncbi:macro domain-containing protein [Ditylenchus destructor]|uniref:Macro domain-containing protein n=1 Tax=Ditylenchus destructor TaxID=166010 RepID=A0AAD4N482_9BILA|nr:macro domain-containing protein [Ditylenchus destructor]
MISVQISGKPLIFLSFLIILAGARDSLDVDPLDYDSDDPYARGRDRRKDEFYPAKRGPWLYEFRETDQEWRDALKKLNGLRVRMGDAFNALQWDEGLARRITGDNFSELRAYHTILKRPRRLASANLLAGIEQVFMELLNYIICDNAGCSGNPFVKNGQTYTMSYAFVDLNPVMIGCRCRFFKKNMQTQLRIAILCKTNTGTSARTILFRTNDVTNPTVRNALQIVKRDDRTVDKKHKITLETINIVHAPVLAIVNSANRNLENNDNKGVNGVIFNAAGPRLTQYLRKHYNGLNPGKAVMTPSFDIEESGRGRARRIIHTVGPRLRYPGRPTRNEIQQLSNCYINSLNRALEHKVTSIAFPPISAGTGNFPKEMAAKIAIRNIRKWLRESNNADRMHRIQIVVYRSRDDYNIYDRLLRDHMAQYYTPQPNNRRDNGRRYSAQIDSLDDDSIMGRKNNPIWNSRDRDNQDTSLGLNSDGPDKPNLRTEDNSLSDSNENPTDDSGTQDDSGMESDDDNSDNSFDPNG